MYWYMCSSAIKNFLLLTVCSCVICYLNFLLKICSWVMCYLAMVCLFQSTVGANRNFVFCFLLNDCSMILSVTEKWRSTIVPYWLVLFRFQCTITISEFGHLLSAIKSSDCSICAHEAWKHLHWCLLWFTGIVIIGWIGCISRLTSFPISW